MISYNNHKFIEWKDNDDDERAESIGPSEIRKNHGESWEPHKRRLLAYDYDILCAVCSRRTDGPTDGNQNTRRRMRRTKSH